MARPRGQFYKMDKRNNPDRRKITEKGESLAHLTPEERKQHTKDWQAKYALKIKDDEKRLEAYREPITLLKTMKEKDEFRKYINEKNKKRLTEILNDSELMWQIFADRVDITAGEIKEMRQKKKEKKGYVTDKEVEKAMEAIYGGYKLKGTILGDDEEDEDEDYVNPYKPINEED